MIVKFYCRGRDALFLHLRYVRMYKFTTIVIALLYDNIQRKVRKHFIIILNITIL